MLTDRVVVITGAGRGLGAEYAVLAAAEGAKVVINDLGCGPDGSGADPTVVEGTADRIRAAGGDVVVSADDMATMDGASAVLELALSSYGRVDGLVNNAGTLRDRMFVNMSEAEWDDVIRGQLRTTFCGSRVFAGHWREVSKAGGSPAASLVNVSSTSGLIGQLGQSNYGAAKAGIAALSLILADELARFDVRVNAVVPVARTRMTENAPGIADLVAAPEDPAEFDYNSPANVAPLVAWLLSTTCTETKQVYFSRGSEIRRMAGWTYSDVFDAGTRWDPREIGATVATGN